MAKVNVHGLEVELNIDELRELIKGGEYGSITRAPAAPVTEAQQMGVHVPAAVTAPPKKMSVRDKTKAVGDLGFLSVTYVVSALRYATSCDRGAKMFPDFVQAKDWMEYFDSRTEQERDLLNVVTSVAGTIARMGEVFTVAYDPPLRAINSDTWLAVWRTGLGYEHMRPSLELMRKRLHGVRDDKALQEKMWSEHIGIANDPALMRNPWGSSSVIMERMFPLLNDLWPVNTPPAPKGKR